MRTKKPNARKRSPRIADDAVRAATGKGWSEWCRILDRAGAGGMVHRDIARLISKTYPGIGMWWHQMVTVGYEEARGLRVKNRRPEGYEVGGSRTVTAPVATLFKAWKDARVRQRWLPGARLLIRGARAPKSMRAAWDGGKTSLQVNFYPKGAGRCRVVVQHSRLADARTARKMKTYWSGRLDRLREMVEA